MLFPTVTHPLVPRGSRHLLQSEVSSSPLSVGVCSQGIAVSHPNIFNDRVLRWPLFMTN